MWEREKRENKLCENELCGRRNKLCGRGGKDARTNYVGEGKARELIMWERARSESKLCGTGKSSGQGQGQGQPH